MLACHIDILVVSPHVRVQALDHQVAQHLSISAHILFFKPTSFHNNCALVRSQENVLL